VVDDHGQVAHVAAVGDLVDPDPPQAIEPVGACSCFGPVPDPRDDRADGAPRDPHQLSCGRPRCLGGQPGHLGVEGMGVPGAVRGPRHMAHNHAVFSAAHPWSVGLEHRDRGALIQRPPTPAATPGVVTGAGPSTSATARPLPGHRPDIDHQDVAVPADVLDRGVFQTQQATP